MSGKVRTRDTSPSTVMDLLAERVPITLLMDLAHAGPIESGCILRAEPADLRWLPGPTAPGGR